MSHGGVSLAEVGVGWEGGRGETRGEEGGAAPFLPGSFDAHLALLCHLEILAFNC